MSGPAAGESTRPRAWGSARRGPKYGSGAGAVVPRLGQGATWPQMRVRRRCRGRLRAQSPTDPQPAGAGHSVGMRAFCLRHGESENVLTRTAGVLPRAPLTEAGRRQARAAAEMLGGESVAAIYSSTAVRAVDTAGIIGELLGVETVSTTALLEVSIGGAEGSTDPAIGSLTAAVLRGWIVDGDLDARVADGESGHEVVARVSTALTAIATAHRPNGDRRRARVQPDRDAHRTVQPRRQTVGQAATPRRPLPRRARRRPVGLRFLADPRCDSAKLSAAPAQRPRRAPKAARPAQRPATAVGRTGDVEALRWTLLITGRCCRPGWCSRPGRGCRWSRSGRASGCRSRSCRWR